MTHDPDRNCLMPTPLGTDVFDWLAGDGFVMVKPTRKKSLQVQSFAADPMPSVVDEVRALEGLLR